LAETRLITSREPVLATQVVRQGLARRIAVGVLRARLALFWENLWPRLIWPLAVALVFVAVAWLGLWQSIPDYARIVGLIGMGLAFLVALATLRGVRIPTESEGLARLEHYSGYRHRPLLTLQDALPAGADAAATALWTAHRARAEATISQLNAGLPAPGVDRADRYALRVVVALMLFVGFFAAGDARYERIRAAFRPLNHRTTIEARLDAWVTPPDYTGKPAILLTADAGPPLDADGSIRVPQGSVLAIRSSGATPGEEIHASLKEAGSDATKQLVAKAATTETPGQSALSATAGKPGATAELELKLAAASEITVTRGTSSLARWRFSITPDTAPTIRFVGQPEPQASGTLKLAYEVGDAYGVVEAEAHFEPSPESFPVTSNAATVRPLVTPPDFALSLPAGHAKSGQATSFRDLTSHAWAGGKVKVTLVARNEAGLEGRSETKTIVLPTRTFSKPLARALVEQRRILALDANRQPQVNDAFDALLIAPEHFYDSSAIYLGVSKIYRDLLNARTDDELRDVAAFMWDVALGIEDGNLTQAEKAVRDAEEALRKALDNGATDAEVAKLTQALRDALDKYMRELAEAARKNPGLKRPPSPNQQVLREQDLKRMLDRIENLAKTGSRDAAREMLSQMQRMLENLQNADGGSQGDDQQSEGNDALDKLGDMIQRQQQLMDKTHRLDRNGDPNFQPNGRRSENAPPMTDAEREQALKDLQKGEDDLRQALKEFRDKLALQGLGKKSPKPKPGQGAPDQNGKTPGGSEPGLSDQEGPFGRAGDAMGDAKDALGDGSAGDAVDAQGRAIDQLRDGAKKLIDEMAQNQGRSNGVSVGDRNQSQGEDPLGRPRRNGGPQDSNSVKVPDEIDTQRARQVLEDIRRRLSEPMRPALELDYLQRLLLGQ
jgi:uncharacterized protein (TIGR02302 family)